MQRRPFRASAVARCCDRCMRTCQSFMGKKTKVGARGNDSGSLEFVSFNERAHGYLQASRKYWGRLAGNNA